MTMTLVSTVTVGAGGAASIDFTSIPQSGTDLLIVFSLRSTGTDIGSLSTSATGHTGLSRRFLSGDGSAASSGTQSANMIVPVIQGTNTTSNTFCSISYYIANYTTATAKSVSIEAVYENNAIAVTMQLIAGLIGTSAAAAMTALTFTNSGGNFAQYSTASLYTIQKGSGGASVA